MKCWRCDALFIPNSTGNCCICGYSQDIEHENEVKKAKIEHDGSASKIGHGIHSWAGDMKYRRGMR
jgi:hypothetical protein